MFEISEEKIQQTAANGASPAIVWETLWAHGRTRALEAAVANRLFDQIAEGDHTAAEIAKRARVSARGAHLLLDVMVAQGLLEKAANRYYLTETARAFLVSTSPAFMGGLIELLADGGEQWSDLSNIVQSDRSGHLVDHERTSREFFPKLVAMLFPSNFRASGLARDALPPEVRGRVKRVLDIAAGAAPWSLAWAAADPGVRVTAHDFEEVLSITKQFVGKLGAADQYDYVAGNLRDVEFESAAYDLVILGHICHSEGAHRSQKLIEKSARALQPGGLLLIADMLPNDDRTGPLTQLIFGLQMLINTPEGDVFTLAQYRAWATSAGLVAVHKLELGANGPDVVVATKPGDAGRTRGR